MRNLISVFGSPQNVLSASERQLLNIEGIDKITVKKIKSGVDKVFVKRQLEYLENTQTQVFSYWDEKYPLRLKSIYDPPAFLFLKGDLSLIANESVGIVGSRTPSEYGKSITQKLARDLVKNGLTVISGFARGVDTIAHKTALDNNGKTIAVLGNGLNVIYPPENKVLLDGFSKNGLMISEYPFDTKPDAANFPKRNRIISGLSIGVLVTEAAAKSGALLTAMYALDQNREIFAVPGPVNSPRSEGTNNLIKQGAKLVQTVNDILYEFEGQFSVKEAKKVKALPVLNENEKVVYQLLSSEAMHIDQIAFKAGISTSQALTILLTLELNGHVRQMAGKMFTQI